MRPIHPYISANRRGQSLILALTIMFLLVFVGGVFVALIGRNVLRSKRSGENLTAEYLAEVGIRYADNQLTYSEDGADWRPVPTYPEVVRKLSAGQDPLTLTPPLRPTPDDPDFNWLMKGFSRYTYGKGRFLLRVAYEPKAGDPLSKYIKIESIGRMGLVDTNDPTTMGPQSPRLRAELVAYKAIGITDYARFITNKDQRSGQFTLGTPNFITTFGENDTQNNTIHGAPIRVNGDLVWHGKDYIWLDAVRGDVVEIAGDISHSVRASGPQNVGNSVTEVLVNGSPAQESAATDGATGRTLFNTSPDDPGAEVGKYRDGRPTADTQGRPRQITRLDPPLLDAVGTGSRLSRYRELTRNSGEWRQLQSGDWYNTGYYGWGRGVYIDNHNDVQEESEGYTLRANWIQPGTEYWNGPYYTPPGVSISLYIDDRNGDQRPDMVITRDQRSRYIWRDQNGQRLYQQGEQIIMPYPDEDGNPQNGYDGVLFAEGNVRIKGTLPPNTRLTIVSGATIYIEGNILRCPFRDIRRIDNSQNLIPPDEPKDSAIGLLAEDYVCVNTTQFFGPIKEVPSAGAGAEYFDVSPQSAFWIRYSFGVSPAAHYQGQPPIRLYARHTAATGGASYINMLINWPPTDQQRNSNAYYSFFNFNVDPWAASQPMEYIYPLGDMAASPLGHAIQQYPEWEKAAFPLAPATPNSVFDLDMLPGQENTIALQLDQSHIMALEPQDYYISRLFVQPVDIRIEALIYAQNKSFFIIPGQWYNPDANDTMDSFVKTKTRPMGTEPHWPFYGQPPDVRITVSGAISENISAQIGDSSAWMEKWGWIPGEHGSSGEFNDTYRPPLDPSNAAQGKPRRGLTFVYDAQLANPFVARLMNAGLEPVRRDEYGRILPLLPKLPVSPQTLYFGEPT